MRPCDVCLLIDGDARPQFVEWCAQCQAWLCAGCQRNWVRRAWAAVLQRSGAA
jgi:hypothetical protein